MNGSRRPVPRARWILVALVALAVSCGLLLQGFANDEIGRSSTRPSTRTTSTQLPALPGTGSVLYGDHGILASRTMPRLTVALTFDDGPDPTWTPRVLAVLRRERVPATFFAVGSRIAAHPDLVRRELAAGDDVGSHTFSHANLSNLSGWRARLEMSMSQLAMAGATGRTSVLMRPPYSSTRAAVTAPDLRAILQLGGDGYVVVLADRDSRDWTRPGWISIVANALPKGSAGAIIVMHDGGGDRSQTVEALPHLIDALKARGYRFTTVGGVLSVAPGAVDPRVTDGAHLRGLALIWVLRIARVLTTFVTWFVAPLGALALLWTLTMVALARRHTRVRRLPTDSPLPPVSVVVPAFNEAVGIAAAIRSLDASDYPELDIVVVDDGSTDDTAAIVEGLGLPNVRVIRQLNSGKAGALNTGVTTARHEVLVLVDGDTVFEPDTIAMLVQQLADPTVGAVAGNAKVGNRLGMLGRWQHLEYVVGFNLERRTFDLLGSMTTVPGAVGAFRRDALAAVGGVSADTLAEDTDLTMAILRAGYRVRYEPRAVAWTEVPTNFNDLWRQRYRWCYGTMQAIWKHRRAAVEPGPARRLGRIGMPTVLAFRVIFPLVMPALDLFAVFGVLFMNPMFVGGVWLTYIAFQMLTAAFALHLDGERKRAVWLLPLQQFAYRQMMYLVVIQSVMSAAAGVRLRWHKLHRTGAVLRSDNQLGSGTRLARR